MPELTVSDETMERLDSFREEGESYEELITELLNIAETEELTSYAGDRF